MRFPQALPLLVVFTVGTNAIGGHVGSDPAARQEIATIFTASPSAQLDSTWKTTINTTTLATTTAFLFISPRREELLTTMTITTLEPPWATASLPTTITETIIKQLTYEQRVTYLETDLTTTSFTTYTGISVHDTWVIHRPQATDLPAGSKSTDDVPCGEEETCAGGPPD
ncbi:hypothetical protein GE09DRAFT_296305 [Coniochaeta sp. 2T2.1]|nr:hypothetical protein GE09DRAFT_296305 [Coniochaeta sp. 2T2.1]